LNSNLGPHSQLQALKLKRLNAHNDCLNGFAALKGGAAGLKQHAKGKHCG
jgi:hypothetical protein